MAAKLAGAGKLIAVDTVDMKLEKAKELGADYAVNASQENPQQKIMEITGGGADYTIECIGNVDVMSQAFSSIHNGGKCVVAGMAPLGAMLTIAPYELLLGKTILGCVQGDIRAPIDIPRYVDLFMAGKLPIDKLVTKKFKGLEHINEALDDLDAARVARAIIQF
jgi:S-(hydroxymethyl)glutathione dehydrogenase/alcohol dehydrogenase